MNVYVVEQGEYSDRHIVGVAESLEEAKSIRKAISSPECDGRITITKYDTKAFQENRLKFLVGFDNYGNISVDTLPEEWGIYGDYTETCCTFLHDYVVYAHSTEQAIKIAQDMEAERKAKEAGVLL